MALLSSAARAQVWERFMREANTNETFTVVKQTLRDSVDAADATLDSSFVSFNAALPLAAQTGLTRAQKLRLYYVVMETRVRQGV